jgi:hypothetical protein
MKRKSSQALIVTLMMIHQNITDVIAFCFDSTMMFGRHCCKETRRPTQRILHDWSSFGSRNMNDNGNANNSQGTAVPRRLLYASSASNIIDSSNIEDVDNHKETMPLTVSDSEIVLACRAYLQRKNRLAGGWAEAAKWRKRKEALLSAISEQQESVGFFWEDPSQLRYLYDNNADYHQED